MDDEPPPLPEPTPVLRMAVEPSPAPAPEPAQPELAPEPAPAPEPALELPPPSLTSVPNFESTVPQVDSKRPMPGTGLMVMGSFSLAASAVLMVGALAGPGWLELERQDAAILAGASMPLALAGGLMVIGGSKSARRYASWSARNQLSAPDSGNGFLVAGSLLTLGFVGAAAYGVHWADNKPIRERGDWAPAIVSGSFAVVGLAVLSAGMLRRSKFVRWERSAYLMPGPLALQRGGGLALTGRF